MDEGDTKGTFGKRPQNWNCISRFVKHSDVTKEFLTGDSVPVLWSFSKGAFGISLVDFSLIITTPPFIILYKYKL